MENSIQWPICRLFILIKTALFYQRIAIIRSSLRIVALSQATEIGGM